MADDGIPKVCQFFAPGRPRTKGSVHAFLSGKGNIIRKDSNPNTKAWAGVVSHAAAVAGVALGNGESVRVSAEFFFARPKSHYGSGRNADKLKASAPARPTSKSVGDIDKLARAVLDALTGVAYKDDSQVTCLSASKFYLEPVNATEGVRITISR